MTHNYFIAGTSTGIGKTFVTCALAHQWRAAGNNVRAIKPVISGDDGDARQLLAAQGLTITPEHVEAIAPWRFSAPISPDQAARREGKTIELSPLVSFCQAAASGGNITLCESAGGIMSPLNERATMLDWAAALQWPVILVGGAYLGSISHALTAIYAIEARKLPLQALVLSESESSPVPAEETMASLRNHTSTNIGFLPRLPRQNEPWKSAPDLLQLIV